jgi:hypothetical protein
LWICAKRQFRCAASTEIESKISRQPMNGWCRGFFFW